MQSGRSLNGHFSLYPRHRSGLVSRGLLTIYVRRACWRIVGILYDRRSSLRFRAIVPCNLLHSWLLCMPYARVAWALRRPALQFSVSVPLACAKISNCFFRRKLLTIRILCIKAKPNRRKSNPLARVLLSTKPT
jgi:hypothetical protein